MPFWHRLLIAGIVFGVVWVVERAVDWRLRHRPLPPEAATRYRVLRRSIFSSIVAVGILSALLVIPAVRAVAGGILASTAVVGIIVGFAAQSTLSNFVAGLFIAFAQPLRLGDRVSVAGEQGVVEEIGLTYTFIRTLDRRRLVVPNSKLAYLARLAFGEGDRETLAEVSVQVPAGTELRRVVDSLRGEGDDVFVTELNGDQATVVVRKWIGDEGDAEHAASDLRISIAERLAAGAS